MLNNVKKNLAKKPKLKKVLKLLFWIFNIFCILWFIFTLIILLLSGNEVKKANATIGDFSKPHQINNVIEKHGASNKSIVDINGTTVTISADLLKDNNYGKVLCESLMNYFPDNDPIWNNSVAPGSWKSSGTTSCTYLYYLNNYDSYETQANLNYIKFYKGYTDNNLAVFDFSLNTSSSHNSGYYFFFRYKFSPNPYNWNTRVAYSGSPRERAVQPYNVNPLTFVFNNYNIPLYKALVDSKTAYENLFGTSQEDLDEAYEEGYTQGLIDGANQDLQDTVTINYNYDFRSYFASNLYTDYGFFSIDGEHYDINNFVGYYYCLSGGSSWYIGNKQYNSIVFVLQPLQPSTKILNLKDGSTSTVSSIIGNSYDNIFYLASVNYAFFDEEYYPLYVDKGFLNPITVGNIFSDADYKVKIANGYTLSYESTGLSYIDLSYSWTESGFRYLQHYISSEVFVNVPNFVNVLSLRQLLELDDTPINNNDGYFYDVFAIIRSAFRSIGDILGISVLPHLTLGTLLFIPLVFAVIMAIIGILRK